MWIGSTSEWLPSGCLPLGHPQAWTGPEPGRQRAGAALPVADARGGPHWGPNGRGDLWPDQPGYGNATGYRRGGLSRPAARMLVGPQARNSLRQSRLRTSHAQHRTWGLSGVRLVYPWRIPGVQLAIP